MIKVNVISCFLWPHFLGPCYLVHIKKYWLLLSFSFLSQVINYKKIVGLPSFAWDFYCQLCLFVSLPSISMPLPSISLYFYFSHLSLCLSPLYISISPIYLHISPSIFLFLTSITLSQSLSPPTLPFSLSR